jgi:hypothetical protein
MPTNGLDAEPKAADCCARCGDRVTPGGRLYRLPSGERICAVCMETKHAQPATPPREPVAIDPGNGAEPIRRYRRTPAYMEDIEP